MFGILAVLVLVSTLGFAASIWPTQASASQGPVAAYSFDEGEGSTAEDSFGEHDGTVEGAGWTKGKFGGALEFDGEAEDLVTIPGTEDLQLEEFTLEAWVRPAQSDLLAPIVAKLDEEDFGYALYSGGDSAAGRPQGYLLEGIQISATAYDDEELPEHAWSHIAVANDGAHIRIYVNGELEDTSPVDEDVKAGGEGPLTIGGNEAFEAGEYFSGKIDEVRVYDRALEAGEVAADKGSGIESAATGPVAAYSFDEGEGSTAEDSFGEHDGTVEGAEWFDRGKFGKALYFDGSEGDLVTVPDSNDLDLADEFTLEAWVRPDEANEWSAVLTKERGEGALSYQMHAEGEGNAPVGYVGNSEGSFEVEAGDDPIPPHVWSHLALIYDGSKLRYYIDGELKGTDSGADPGPSADPLLIGGDISWGEEDAFKGLIDEVRVYDRALSEAEVQGDQGAGIETSSRAPVAAYSFDAGEGSTAEDVSGNEHDGAIEGAEWFDRGKYGKALSFDGENDCVTVADAEDLRITEELTVEGWVKARSPLSDDPVVYKDTSGETGHGLGIGIYNYGKPEAFIGEGEGEFESVVSPEKVEANVWSHLAFTYDGGHMRLYVNGDLVASQSQSEGAPWGEGDLVIGCNPNYPEHFQGLIDEVRIYNRALDEEEVAASLGSLPFVRTEESEADSTEAVLLGTVNPMGYVTTYRFEYGTTSAYGKSIPESANEIEEWVTGHEPEEVDQAIDELEPETTYHYRIVATNALGSFVGHDQTFTTSAAEPSPLAATSFEGRVGVNWSGLLTSPTETQEVDESGAEMFRVVVNPGCTENEEDLKKHRTHNDELFLSMAENHVTILPDVNGIPCRQGGNRLPPIGSGTGALKRWKDGLEALAKRYGPEGGFWEKYPSLKAYAPTYWEIWNEENVENNAAPNGELVPERYGQLLGASNDLLDEVDGKIKILFGGLLTIGKTKPKITKNGPIPGESEMRIRTFLKRAGHIEDYDAVSLHPYAFLGSVQSVTGKVKRNIRRARAAVNKYGGGQSKDIWVTEIGWAVAGEPGPDPVHVAISPAVQEERLNSVFDMIKNRSAEDDFNIRNIFWYNIRDVAGAKWDAHCGLLDREGSKRSAFAAFKAQAE
jgi:hypothetical protein